MPDTRTVQLRPDLTVTLAEDGTGRTALILHGGGGPATVQNIAAHLSGTMHVITPTHPGWDGTERPGWLASVNDLALAYLQLLKDEGHRDVLVIGSSIGGWIGTEMAVHDNGGLITGLVLMDSAGVLIEGQPMADFFALDARGVAEYSYHDPDRFYVDPATIPPEQAARRAANMATLRVLAGAVRPELLRRLGQVKIPVLVLWGDSDRIFTPEYGRAFPGRSRTPGSRSSPTPATSRSSRSPPPCSTRSTPTSGPPIDDLSPSGNDQRGWMRQKPTIADCVQQRRYGVDIGIGLPNTVPDTEGRALVDWARTAEEAGFSTLGTIGRIVFPNYEELIALSAAAAVTSRIRLTTGVLLAPLYSNAALFAKQAASLDRLSGGRLVLGLGLGGREDDFVGQRAEPRRAAGGAWKSSSTMMKRIWSGEEFGYRTARSGPSLPGRGGPEIILGGASEASFRRVARVADGWIMGGGTPEMFAQGGGGRGSRPGRRRAAAACGASSRLAVLRARAGGPQPRRRATCLHYYGWLGEIANMIAGGAAVSAGDGQVLRRGVRSQPAATRSIFVPDRVPASTR